MVHQDYQDPPDLLEMRAQLVLNQEKLEQEVPQEIRVELVTKELEDQ